MTYIKAFFGMSLNGYIGQSVFVPAKFSSKETMSNLKQSLSYFDAVLIGANTLKAYGTSLSPLTENQPIQLVFSRKGELDNNLPFFTQKSIKSRHLIVTNSLLPINNNSRHWNKIIYFDGDWSRTLRNYPRIACLGGSYLFQQLLQAKLITDLELSISPVFFETGIRLCDINLNLTLLYSNYAGNDINLTYKINY